MKTWAAIILSGFLLATMLCMRPPARPSMTSPWPVELDKSSGSMEPMELCGSSRLIEVYPSARVKEDGSILRPVSTLPSCMTRIVAPTAENSDLYVPASRWHTTPHYHQKTKTNKNTDIQNNP